jgi:Carboxypeptidase regulatory-like domain/TonB dependent receptor
MKLLRSFTPLFCFLALLLMAISPAFAQNTLAALSGQVTDSTGASVPGAAVTVTDVRTNIAHKVISDDKGSYLVPNLIPDPYQVTVELTGFDKKVLSGITLEVGRTSTLNIAMAVGSVNTTVSVTTAAAVTDTAQSQVGSVIDTTKIIGLPLNQRSFYSLPLLAPGVEQPAQNSTLGFRGGFNVSGNEETSNTFTVNGIDDDDQDVNAPSFRPSVEAIQEFNILTGVYSAEYGRSQGGQVVVITKSGGNEFHGDAFEFIRNQVTDAKNYFTLPGAPPTFRRNQWGGTIGGPFLKNRLFFFASYEEMNLAQEVSALSVVPTLGERTGNFAGTGITVNQPGTATPYANDQITNISPIGQAIINAYPMPNIPNAPVGSNNYLFDEARIENNYVFGSRLDYKISNADSLAIQINYFNDPSFEPSNSLCGSAVIPGFGCTTNQRSTLMGVNWIHIFKPSLLNEFRFGWDRLVQPRVGQDLTNTSFPGLPGVTNPGFLAGTPFANDVFGAPNSSVSGYASQNVESPQQRWDNHYNLIDNVTWTHGNHELKFGLNLLQARYTNLDSNDVRGVLVFNSSEVAGAGAPTTGNSLGDLLVGRAYEASRAPTSPVFEMRYHDYAGFVQDNWKASKDLTINLGLRYEYFSPLTEIHNQISTYDITTQAIVEAGGPGVGSQIYQTDKKNWAPRVGIAWQPFHNPGTVIHAAYGIFYNSPPIGNGTGLGLLTNVPMRDPQSLFTTAGSPIQIDNNPFPNPSTCASGQTLGSASTCPLLVTPTGIAPYFRTMYVNEWSLDIQHQITQALALTVGYVGSTGHRLPSELNPNQPVVTNGMSASTRPVLGAHEITYPSTQFFSYNNINYYMAEGSSNFNSLQVKLQQQYHAGLSMIVAYTWSKSLDDTPGYASTSNSSAELPQNSYNLRGEYGVSDFNVSQRLVISPVWDIPLGPGHALINHGVASKLVEGWQLSGIAQAQTGRPFTVTNSNANNSGSFNDEDRPDQIANPNNGPKTVAKWFNTSAFSTADVAPGTFGNEARNAVVGPTFFETDLALQRNFALSHRFNMPIRFEVFDVFNNPNFFNPLGAGQEAGTSSFGTLTESNSPREMQLSAKLIW